MALTGHMKRDENRPRRFERAFEFDYFHFSNHGPKGHPWVDEKWRRAFERAFDYRLFS